MRTFSSNAMAALAGSRAPGTTFTAFDPESGCEIVGRMIFAGAFELIRWTRKALPAAVIAAQQRRPADPLEADVDDEWRRG